MRRESPSPNFNLIQSAIQAQKPISAKYNGDRGYPRRLFPHVLGFTCEEAEVVLCYQFGGYSPMRLDSEHPSPKNWRCFRVEALSDVEMLDMERGPWTPRGYSADKQNSVTVVKAKL